MYPHSQEHDWDTPPNGDFVRYLERLAVAAPAAAAVITESTAPRPDTPKAAPATAALVLPLASQWGSVLSALRKVRVVLLWLTLAHFAAWLLLDRGSGLLLIFMVSVWVALGRVLTTLPDIGHPSNTARSGLERLQQEIRSLAQQRQHQKSKK